MQWISQDRTKDRQSPAQEIKGKVYIVHWLEVAKLIPMTFDPRSGGGNPQYKLAQGVQRSRGQYDHHHISVYFDMSLLMLL